MTNAQIIAIQQVELQKQGILKYTGKTVKGLNVAGEVVEIPEIQPIHTYASWKSRGYRVKKGEKAVAKFPIWKFVVSPKKEELEEEDLPGQGKMIMRVAAFFTDEQVEKIEGVAQ